MAAVLGGTETSVNMLLTKFCIYCLYFPFWLQRGMGQARETWVPLCHLHGEEPSTNCQSLPLPSTQHLKGRMLQISRDKTVGILRRPWTGAFPVSPNTGYLTCLKNAKLLNIYGPLCLRNSEIVNEVILTDKDFSQY